MAEATWSIGTARSRTGEQMTTAKVQSQSTGGLADIADTVAELLDHGLAREAEVVIGFLAIWLLGRVEAGRMTRETADQVFTALDVRVSSHPKAADLSEASQDLVTEGEHFHHYGEEWGPDPDYLRKLAFAILRRETLDAPAS